MINEHILIAEMLYKPSVQSHKTSQRPTIISKHKSLEAKDLLCIHLSRRAEFKCLQYIKRSPKTNLKESYPSSKYTFNN